MKRRNITYFLVIGFAFSFVYLARKTPLYLGQGSILKTLHFLSLACILGNILCLIIAVKKRIACKEIFLPIWLRYSFLALTLSLFMTCTLEVNPRAVFRALLFIFVTPIIFFFSSIRMQFFLRKAIRSRGFKFLDLSCFNLVLLVLLLEVTLRVTAIFSNSIILSAPNIKAAERIKRNQLPPGKLHSGFPANALGFYDQEFKKKKAAKTLRILGLTDSFGVETVSYSYNFLTLLETELGQPKQGKSVEVFNLGIDQLSPAGYLYLTENYFNSYNADFALVCVFTGNDITGLPQKSQTLSFLRKDFWYIYFVSKRIYRLTQHEVRQNQLNVKNSWENPHKNQAEYPGYEENTKPTFSKKSFLEIERKRLEVCLPEGTEKRIDKGYQKLGKILQQIKKITNNKLLVVLIPDEFQVNDLLWREITKDNKNQYIKQRPGQELAAICAKEGIKYIDLLPPLRAAQTRQPVYHLQDTHWNRFGHAVAAKAIAEKLRNVLEIKSE